MTRDAPRCSCTALAQVQSLDELVGAILLNVLAFAIANLQAISARYGAAPQAFVFVMPALR